MANRRYFHRNPGGWGRSRDSRLIGQGKVVGWDNSPRLARCDQSTTLSKNTIPERIDSVTQHATVTKRPMSAMNAARA